MVVCERQKKSPTAWRRLIPWLTLTALIVFDLTLVWLSGGRGHPKLQLASFWRTIFSALQLTAIALAAFANGLVSKRSNIAAWSGLAAFFLFLATDDLLELHESAAGWLAVRLSLTNICIGEAIVLVG